MTCFVPRILYANPPFRGLAFAGSRGDGYGVELKWIQAYSGSPPFQIVYNLYYSTGKDDVFSDGVKFVVTDPTTIQSVISGLTPGKIYFFAVRGALHNPNDTSISGLPDGDSGYKTYPEAMLLSNISANDLTIKVSDITLFPAKGVVQIGAELIAYTSIDLPNSELVLSDISKRGYYSTEAREHQTDGYDGYVYRDPLVKFFIGYEDGNKAVVMAENRFFEPNFARTDADGYRTQKDILTTDFSADEEENIGFDVFDYAGYRRTDPVDLLAGKCLGSYYGGQYFCADGYGGVGTQVRGIDIATANNQRQEVLLSTTGRPCVLVKRLWSGITCSCVSSSRETPEHRCPRCFAPGTFVRTSAGFVPIEKINIGDQVLTTSGEYQSVTKVFITPFKGKLVSINSSVSTKPILATPEHPFLVLRGAHGVARGCGPKCNDYIKRGDGVLVRPHDIRQLPSGRWHARATIDGKRKILGTFDTYEEAVSISEQRRVENNKCGHHLIWDEAGMIKKNDWLVPRWSKSIKDINNVSIPQEFRKNPKLGSQRFGSEDFVVDQEFMWVVGMYLAEGYCKKRTVTFALHEKEIGFQNRLIEFFERYGYNVSVYRSKTSKGVSVNVHSTSLAQWLPVWLGRGCQNKRVPEELMQLPDYKTKALISGVYDGDGSKRENEITQTSEILALQLVELLHRCGHQPLVRQQISKALTPKGNRRKVAYCVNWEEDTLTHQNRKWRWVFGEDVLSQVRGVTKVPYDGMVYNLEVNGDHTYVVGGIAVHNCFGTGFVTGYEQFYNPRRSDGRIMVRFDATVEDLLPMDAGLESDFKPNAWTLSVPILKDRDFLIRFNQDGTEEFRYEILNVTRNYILLNQVGGQKFSCVRVRKTDPIYQWRAFRNTANMPSVVSTSIGLVPGPGGILPHTHNIVVNENVISLVQLNQTTSVAQGHNHPIVAGQVLPVLGHTHTIVL